MRLSIRPVISIVAMVMTLLWGSVSQAQEYPFFVQPMSVKDVRGLSEDLGLSREQSLAVLGQYEAYNQQFEELQDGDVRDLMDQAMDMVMEARWWGGNFAIPQRRDIEAIVNRAQSVFRTFGRIDESLFDEMVPLLSDRQLVLLDRAKRDRALVRYEVIHRNLTGEINDGAQPNLPRILDKIDVIGERGELVAEIIDGHAKRLTSSYRRFESTMLETMGELLDEVDRLGLRDMEMADMMVFFTDEAKLDDLKLLFNELSKPLQEVASRLSRENLRTYKALIEVLDEEQQQALQERFFASGYRDCSADLLPLRHRLERLSEEFGETVEGEEVRDALYRFNDSFGSFCIDCAQAFDAQRTYRTFAMLEDSDLLPEFERVEAIMHRHDRIAESAERVVEKYTEDEDEDADEVAAGEKGGGGGSDGGKDGGRSKAQLARDAIKVEPLEAQQVEQFGRWLGADDTALAMMAALHRDYDRTAGGMLEEHGQALLDAADDDDDDPDTRRSWVEQQQVRREARAAASAVLAEYESALFDDLALALPDSIDRARIDRIRAAMSRSRHRSGLASGDWLLRAQQESMIDLTALILANDPTSLTVEQRNSVLDGLVAYDAAVEGAVARLEEQLEAVQGLERRLWRQSDGEEYSPEVQQAMRTRWEKRRAEVGEAAGELAELNRTVAAQIFDGLPEEAAWPLRNAYRQEAYPDVYKAARPSEKAIDAAMSLEGLTPEQARQLETLAGEYRGDWTHHTREMVEIKQQGDVSKVFPPTRESMEAGLAMERHKYQRALLEQRTLVRIELMLDPTQVTQVPGLWNSPDVESSESAEVDL